MDSNETASDRATLSQSLRSHDYVSPGMSLVIPDTAFPDMIVGNTADITWPFLRRWVEHNWYADRHDPTTGFANRDEASIIHNNACLFQGKPSLEIGCWRGWSAVHIALATGRLDVIDPIISDPAIAGKIRESFAAAGVLDRVELHQGFSPDAIHSLAAKTGRRWSFIFIDGNHDDDAPSADAEAVMQYASDTAMVLFHDLASPHVAKGLKAMRDAGWNTMLYQTMQIMGIAWRGDVQPVQHLPDPNVFWTIPRHLAGFSVSGWTPPRQDLKEGWRDGMTMEDRRNVALLRAQALDDDLLETRSALASMDVRLQTAYAESIRARAQLNAAKDRTEAAKTAADLLQSERDAVVARAVASENALARLTEHVADMTGQVMQIQEILATQSADYYEMVRKSDALEQRVSVMTIIRAAQEARVQTLREACLGVLRHNADQAHIDTVIVDFTHWIARRRVLAGLLRRTGAERIAIIRSRANSAGIGHMLTDHAIIWAVHRRTLLGLLRRSTSSAQALIASMLIQAVREKQRMMTEKIAAAVHDATLIGFMHRRLSAT